MNRSFEKQGHFKTPKTESKHYLHGSLKWMKLGSPHIELLSLFMCIIYLYIMRKWLQKYIIWNEKASMQNALQWYSVWEAIEVRAYVSFCKVWTVKTAKDLSYILHVSSTFIMVFSLGQEIPDQTELPITIGEICSAVWWDKYSIAGSKILLVFHASSKTLEYKWQVYKWFRTNRMHTIPLTWMQSWPYFESSLNIELPPYLRMDFLFS